MITPVSLATEQSGDYPRPQLLRQHWCELDGWWEFGFGDDPAAHPNTAVFDSRIRVPYPPESPASGIGDTGYHHVAWYRREFGERELRQAGHSDDAAQVLLHFGAVDWSAHVWLNGILLGRHDGGQSPFSFDITSALSTSGTNTLIVRAIDDPHDVSIPRGKQDWREAPHAIWYHRTTGIWQPVWLEAVAPIHLAEISWTSDIPGAAVDADLTLSRTPGADTWAHVVVSFAGHVLADARFRLLDRVSHLRLGLGRQRNGQQYEELLWSPDHPRLLDVSITISDSGTPVDAAASYLGLRSAAATDRHFLLNDRPLYLRSVLAQNYWPQSHLAAPDAGALRREVELIKELGFNAARVHQKAEDPRFLYWADRLGLMVWAETASAYEFNDRAIAALTTEWMSLVRRDKSHPSVVAWVPMNESWGVQHIAHDERQRSFSRALAELTRALDGTRPVISNDGWEHTDSDIWTIHDYDADPDQLAARYRTPEAVQQLLHGFGLPGRRISTGEQDRGQPIMLTEFGGVSYTDLEVDGAWGYSAAESPEQFLEQVTDILRAVRSSPALAGFCYTQLTDTGQETNGLLRADRSPKVPIEALRRAICGD